MRTHLTVVEVWGGSTSRINFFISILRLWKALPVVYLGALEDFDANMSTQIFVPI